MNLSHVLVKAVLTEKTVKGTAVGKYTFLIHDEATKVDVKQALKSLYGADIVKVNIVKGYPKYKWGKGRRPVQKRAMTRRAIVTLKKGEKLDLSKPKTVK